jgi:hypothetical protein
VPASRRERPPPAPEREGKGPSTAGPWGATRTALVAFEHPGHVEARERAADGDRGGPLRGWR